MSTRDDHRDDARGDAAALFLRLPALDIDLPGRAYDLPFLSPGAKQHSVVEVYAAGRSS